MCVDASRSRLFGRAEFLAVVASAAAPLVAAPASAEPAHPLEPPGPVLVPPPGLSVGNARAARIAAASPFVRRTYAATLALAHSIGDPTLRASVLALLADPRPLYAGRHPSPEARADLRKTLLLEGLLTESAPLAGIFPPGTEPEALHAPQPFWATAGSGEDSHHAYPGGLAVHEYFNATMAAQVAASYDRVYFKDAHTADRDVVVAAAFYHDIMKSVVFGWREDGTLLEETPIAGTGGHHVLSGAEAIVRGMTPRLVITLLSAHAAPSLGDEVKVVNWCRAAAIVAGVDPIAYGLLRKDGARLALAPEYVPIEAFVSYLSDHDFVLSIPALREVVGRLRQVTPFPGRYSSFAWFKNDVLAHLSAVTLYQTLVRGGDAAFDRAVAAFLAGGSSV
jgi:hypothetical protein